jgi:hypothetical protein
MTTVTRKYDVLFDADQKYIDAGCRPLTANKLGSPATWECPKGTVIK